MISIALSSSIVIAHILGEPLSHALEKPVYVIPTAIPKVQISTEPAIEHFLTDFEWRIHNALRDRVQRMAPRKKDLNKGPEVRARAAIVMDEVSQKVLWQLNPDHVQSIASITKLLTALTFLDHQPSGGFFAEHTFTVADDAPQGKELNLPIGEKLTIFNIWHSTLIASYNDAALALVHSSTLSHQEFVRAMNEKAQMIGMKQTRIVDPTGLSAQNVASVEDVAHLARYAFMQKEIVDATLMNEHVQETIDSHLRTVARTTNTLLFDEDMTVTAGKTGYIEEAGYCVVERVRIPDTERNIIIVVLGAQDDEARFSEAKKIALWSFAHHEWD